MNAPVVIRSCHTRDEFHACVALQREIWGEEPLEVEPATMFVVAAHTGGQVIGAFAGDALVGFLLAVAGVRDGVPYLHSHMTGIKDGHRDQGIGRKLKLFQREEALRRGIKLIEWTFDPLELRNAHFNLNRLGAICRKYLPNLYGVTTSPLHRGLRTDRLLAEWHLECPSVIARIDGARGETQKAEVAERESFPGGDVPGTRISVPASAPDSAGDDAPNAIALQDRLRDEFTKRFAEGFHAVAIDTSAEPSYILIRMQRTL
jgi:predicted GNAT superfamily acetyltransferase